MFIEIIILIFEKILIIILNFLYVLDHVILLKKLNIDIKEVEFILLKENY